MRVGRFYEDILYGSGVKSMKCVPLVDTTGFFLLLLLIEFLSELRRDYRVYNTCVHNFEFGVHKNCNFFALILNGGII